MSRGGLVADPKATPDAIRAEVRKLILEEFLPGTDPGELSDSTPLITGGILDSLGTVKVVAALEDRYGIEIEAHEASVTHFNSVGDIVQLVQTKLRPPA
jgi:acyl carrier protein